MAYYYPHHRFGDTTFTKVFVGGLAWETETDVMRRYFEQFGEILEAVIIRDKNTGKSKGYGFVTFRDPESATRACANPNPIIDGRRANCNIASFGRPRASPPRARNQIGTTPPFQRTPSPGNPPYAGASSQFSPAPPPPLPPSPVVYPTYGYTTYTPEYWYQQQSPYNQQLQQYYQQMQTTSSGVATPFYGYPLQAAPRGMYAAPPQAHRTGGPSYLYYPAQVGPFSPYPPPSPPPTLRHPSFPSSSDLQTPHHQTSTEAEAGAVGPSETSTPNTRDRDQD